VPFEELASVRRDRVVGTSIEGPALVRTCSFHPEYGYEDFIEGYRPTTSTNGNLGFSVQPGVFRRLCADAQSAEELDFFLIIDEINRGDIPRIFGELLTLLERDKRDEPVVLPLSGDVFRVPPNVFVLGTMNTADRSIALLDVALRRRFGFVELMPDSGLLERCTIGGLPLGAWLDNLNARIRANGGDDGRNRQVGHAFFLERGHPITTIDQFAAVLRDDIVPLLEEYSYNSFEQLVDLLGPRIVDVEGQRIRRELFEPARGPDLIQALSRPEISTTVAAVLATASSPEPAIEEEENELGEIGPGN
jgi:5-methylcytosine-specific restriction protein B